MLESVFERRSVRTYLPREVSDSEILALIESARLAPSGSNTQPWNFIVIRSAKMREAVMLACHEQRWMLQAPVFIACVADLRCRLDDTTNIDARENSPIPEVKLIIRDAAIAIEHLVLQAQENGLSTCWIAWFTQGEIRPVLSIPPDKYVVAVVTVGYSDERPAPRPRRALEDIVRYERW